MHSLCFHSSRRGNTRLNEEFSMDFVRFNIVSLFFPDYKATATNEDKHPPIYYFLP